ncbi:MAG: TPM domain-containing protein [Patescibacteria group bacterium]
MRFRLIKFISCIFLLFIFAGNVFAYYDLGEPTGYVNDYTNTFSLEQKQALEDKLNQFGKDTTNELAIVIINSLEGDTIENFAVELFKDWGIGEKGKDNGVLMLVALEDRKIRIEVGYGLEGALTDAQSSWIINQVMKPAFRNNDYYNGINEAADKIIMAAKGEYVPSADSQADMEDKFGISMGIIFFALFVFIWLASILGRSKSWWLGGVLGAIVGLILGFIKGFIFFGIVSIAVLLPVGLLLDYIVSKQYKAGKAKGHIPWWTGGGWGGGGRGRGGGFGGFGGGMSGGGGSSGGW